MQRTQGLTDLLLLLRLSLSLLDLRDVDLDLSLERLLGLLKIRNYYVVFITNCTRSAKSYSYESLLLSRRGWLKYYGVFVSVNKW